MYLFIDDIVFFFSLPHINYIWNMAGEIIIGYWFIKKKAAVKKPPKNPQKTKRERGRKKETERKRERKERVGEKNSDSYVWINRYKRVYIYIKVNIYLMKISADLFNNLKKKL